MSERFLGTGAYSLWYHFGPHGETRQLTNAAGATVDTYVYTAYGVPGPTTGTDRNPFRFGGQAGYYTDPGNSSELVLCGQRWYHPYLARWMTRDPVGYGGGENLYGYCNQDPVDCVDPSGLLSRKRRFLIDTDMGDGCAGSSRGGADGLVSVRFLPERQSRWYHPVRLVYGTPRCGKEWSIPVSNMSAEHTRRDRMRKLRLGMLGASWWTDVVCPGFRLAPNAELAWIASRTPERARDAAAKHGIARWGADYREVLSDPDIDAVFIGLPNHLHHEIAMEALRQGKHVLQEKPMALTLAQAAEQAAEARAHDRQLMVNLELRLADGFRDLQPIIAERIGPLRKVALRMMLSPGAWGGWRADPALTGGSLFEMAIHQLDLAHWLFGRDPLSVWATGEDVAGHDFTAVLDFGAGDSAIIDFCWRGVGFHARIECTGEGGLVGLDIAMPFGDGFRTIITREGVERTPVEINAQGPQTFQRVLEGFADAALNGAPLPIPTSDGVWAICIAEGTRQSMRTGERVPLAVSVQRVVV